MALTEKQKKTKRDKRKQKQARRKEYNTWRREHISNSLDGLKGNVNKDNYIDIWEIEIKKMPDSKTKSIFTDKIRSFLAKECRIRNISNKIRYNYKIKKRKKVDFKVKTKYSSTNAYESNVNHEKIIYNSSRYYIIRLKKSYTNIDLYERCILRMPYSDRQTA